MKHILKCTQCEQWTMQELHSCRGKAVSTKPLKYTPNDKYADYRRRAREGV